MIQFVDSYSLNRLEQDGVIANCGLNTMDAHPLNNFSSCSSLIPSKVRLMVIFSRNQVIIEAKCLKEAFEELDW